MAPVVHLDTFRVLGEDGDAISENKLLALHADGTVICYFQDLESEEWRTKIECTTPGSDHELGAYVKYGTIISVEQAQKGVLRSRQDILAPIGLEEENQDRSLLLAIIRSTPISDDSHGITLNLKIFDIQTTYSQFTGPGSGIGKKIRELATLVIPEPLRFKAKDCHIELHPSSGVIYQHVEDSLAIYDLTGSVPRLTHDLAGNDMSSCLRISSDLLAFSKADSLSVIDLAYCSLQAERPLISKPLVTHKLMAFQDQNPTNVNVRFLSYYSPLNLLIALEGHKLLAVQLMTSQQEGKSRKRKRDGLLVNSIGRGSSFANALALPRGKSHSSIKSLGPYLPLSSTGDDWDEARTSLDQYLAQGNEKEFVRVLASVLKLGDVEADDKCNSVAIRQYVDPRKVDYVLGAIFIVDKSTNSVVDLVGDNPRNLHIRFLSPTISEWLIRNTLLVASRVERALKHSGALPLTAKIACGALVQALADWDPSLGLLSSFLASSIPLSSRELAHVLATITPGRSDSVVNKILTTGKGENDNNRGDQMQLTDGENAIFSPSAPLVLVDGRNAHLVLNLAITRLYACPSSSVASALKSELSTSQLRVLVDALRMEIARSGWFSPYEDTLEAADHVPEGDRQLCFIAHLFNCLVDNIGTGGLMLSTSAGDDFTEISDTITYMKAEISAALEGVEESTYLKGILGEMLLCSKDKLHSPEKSLIPTVAQLTAPPAKPVTIPFEKEDSSFLPLGLKGAPVISTTKVGAGGELMKRSKRDIGRLKSKMVGKYSFERLVI